MERERRLSTERSHVGGQVGGLVFQRRRRGSAPSCRMGGVLERVPGAGAEMGEGAND